MRLRVPLSFAVVVPVVAAAPHGHAGVPEPAARAAATTARLTAFTLTQVNQETRRVRPGAEVPLCQAIPFTELAPHVRWSGAPRRGLRATVELSAPGHRDRPLRRALRAPGRSGTRRVTFVPGALDDGAFPEGRYVARVRASGRVLARAELRIVAPVARSC